VRRGKRGEILDGSASKLDVQKTTLERKEKLYLAAAQTSKIHIHS